MRHGRGEVEYISPTLFSNLITIVQYLKYIGDHCSHYEEETVNKNMIESLCISIHFYILV